MGIRDTRMIARAITHGYPITDEQRKALLSVLLRVALDPSNSPREKTAAARAIMAADQLNIEREKMSQADDHHGDQLDQQRLNRLAFVAKQLGFNEVARIASEGGSGDLPEIDAEATATAKSQGSRTRSRRQTQKGKAKRSSKN
jgi:plasmid stability protein